MRVYSPHCLDLLSRLAREHGALVIHDEIATGFWRTGTAFGRDHAAGQAVDGPDIVCVGKALTGGYLTLAAVLCSDEVANRVSNSVAGALMHGPTFMANPLACAVASASLDLLEAGDPAANVARIETALAAGLAPAADLDCVAGVRVLGAVGVIELTTPVDVTRVTSAALDRGIWVRPFRNLVYTMPPYVTSDDDLADVATAMVGAVEEVYA
jgi:adenosylmethionine-8-amino-7-oxononanoate aminotransferase